MPRAVLILPLLVSGVYAAPLRAGRARPNIRPAPGSNVRECVLGIVEHDVKELGFSVAAECARCARAMQRESVSGLGQLSLHPVLAFSAPAAGAPGASALKRIGRIYATQQLRLALLIDSYVHWRLPLALWWVGQSTAERLEPLEPMLAPLAPMLAPLLSSAARGLHALGARGQRAWSARSAGALASADSSSARGAEALALSSFEAGNLQEALLHMRPQIVAKIRHASFHEPAALGTFAAVALRLALLVPLLQLAQLVGSPAAALRQRLLRLVLRDALLVSERCNRVERRRNLPPPRPRQRARIRSAAEQVQAVAAAMVARSARALERLAAPTAQARR